jgi:transcriptional regulator with XRE-family HTH domain
MTAAKQTFGSMLRALRQERGLSLRALARAAEVDVAWLQRIETSERRPSRDLIDRLAKVLGADAEQWQALATENLPRYGPYLRAKYDLPDEAVAELEAHFENVARQYEGKRRRS